MADSLLHRVLFRLHPVRKTIETWLWPPRIDERLLARSLGKPATPSGDSCRARLQSSLCRGEELESVEFRRWSERLGEQFRLHRKLWEWCYICEALAERGYLQPGHRGLGFAVGQEPLPSLFAAMGCRIMASDLATDDTRARTWEASGQWASNLAALNARGLCSSDQFARLVEFQAVDMNAIPDELCRGEFDFTWSSCSFEHCGSLRLGQEFFRRQMNCLRPGGLAVHTTEFNLSSNKNTISEGETVIYRRRDIEELIADLESDGHMVEPLNLHLGHHRLARHIDFPPYKSDQHLRLALMGFVTTSVGLIIQKKQS